MEKVTWCFVKNTVSDRMTNDSLTHALQVRSKIKKRTKIVNQAVRKFSGLKSYRQYLDIKRSCLNKVSVEDESDYEVSSRFNISSASFNNFDASTYSTYDENEADSDYDDILIGRNPNISLSERQDKNCSRGKESKKGRPKNRTLGLKFLFSTF